MLASRRGVASSMDLPISILDWQFGAPRAYGSIESKEGRSARMRMSTLVQSLVFTDKANAAWPQLVERFRSDCRRQFQYLRGPGQAADVSEHVRSCVVAKVRGETGRAGVGEAGAGPQP